MATDDCSSTGSRSEADSAPVAAMSPVAPAMPQDDEELLDVEDCSSDAEDYFQPKRARTDRDHHSHHHNHHHHQVRSTSAEPVPPPAHQQPKPLTSFFIKDILSGNKAAAQAAAQRAAQQAVAMSSLAAIVRPWDSPNGTPPPRRPRSTDEDSISESDSPESPASTAAAALLHRRHQAALAAAAAAARRQASGGDPQNADSSPLDALFEMTSKTFETLEHADRAALGEWW